MKFGICAVFLAVASAGDALADARFSAGAQAPNSLRGLVYTQIQINDLTESDLRRLVFYAERATHTLQNLVEGAGSRSIVEQDKANTRFRESIARLVDAGQRSGLSVDQIADYFTQTVAQSFGQDFMQQVGQLAQGLDFRTLFRNVSTVPDPRTTVNDDGSNFLNALAQASRDLQQITTEPQTVQIETTTPGGETQGPVPLPNATAADRSIIDRVVVNQGRWEITIETGDSLSAIASAIYGDSHSFAVIYDANTGVITNPNVIEVGTVLVLPKP